MPAAIDTNSLTLAEIALQSNNPLVKKITYNLYQTGNVLQDIPFKTANVNMMRGLRYDGLNGSLPTPNWRKINELPTLTKGKAKEYQEQVFILSNLIAIDRHLLSDENLVEDPLQSQINLYLETAKYEINQRFLLNDPSDPSTGDPDAWAGLRTRLDNPNTYGIPSEMKINGSRGSGTTLDLRADGTNGLDAASGQNTANAFIETVQTALDYIGAPDGDGVVIYCNDIMKRRFEYAIRKLGVAAGFTTDKDAFDRPVSTYKGAKIRDIGRRANQTDRILGDETTSGTPGTGTGSSITYSSLYFVRYGDGYFSAWQKEPLAPKNLGLDPTNGMMFNCSIDWACGLWMPYNRAIARVFNVRLS